MPLAVWEPQVLQGDRCGHIGSVDEPAVYGLPCVCNRVEQVDRVVEGAAGGASDDGEGVSPLGRRCVRDEVG